MLTLPSSVRIFLATEPCDMRKGFYSLSALVFKYGEDVFSGHLFVFVSRKRNRLKILTWQSGGFVMLYKRLEKGRFKLERFVDNQLTVQLEPAQLTMLLEGIDYSRVRRPKRWNPPKRKNSP